MKKTIGIFLSLNVLCIHICIADTIPSIALSSALKKQKMNIALHVIQSTEHDNNDLHAIAMLVKKMLERKRQALSGFSVTIQTVTQKPSKNNMNQLYHEGYPLALFTNMDKQCELEWRLYDTHQGTMIKGKKITGKTFSTQHYAEHLLDELWPLLTGQEGFFSTRIAFCKESNPPLHKQKQLYLMAPYSDLNDKEYPATQLLLDNTNAFALRWNQDSHNPMVLYSEITICNVRLMGIDLNHKRRIISNFDGLNMLPYFSSDGRHIVYCMSAGGKTNIFSYENNPSAGIHLKQITHNGGNNTSPNLRDNGDIIFCSDFQTKHPQLYYYHAQTQRTEQITHGGYCAGPNFCAKNNKVAYLKLLNGTMQIFLYDCIAKKHYQITFDPINKEDCSWSPCGNYLVFTATDSKNSRIALLNLITSERTYLTSSNDRCKYPAWSPTIIV